jgi:hypothetical protein
MTMLRPTISALSTSITAPGIGCVVSLSARSQAGSAQAQPVDAARDRHIPNKYHTHYEYLGSWSVVADGKRAKEIHTVRQHSRLLGCDRLGGKQLP